MKYSVILFALFAAFQAQGQCSQWLGSLEQANKIVKKAESYFNVKLQERPHQENAEYTWRSTDGRLWVKALADANGKVSKIVIRGLKSATDKLVTDLFSDVPAECVTEKRKNVIKLKDSELNIREEEFNPRVTTEPLQTITISSL